MRVNSILSSAAAIFVAIPCLALSGDGDPYIERERGDDVELSLLDIQPNNAIDMGDVAFLLADWGLSGSPADFNGDGIVDGADLGALLANFGSTIDVAWPLIDTDPGDVGPPVDCLGCDNSEA
jgi:hypothetical protein